MYLAKIEGTYKSKIYIDLKIFKIVRGWKTDHFSYSRVVDSPEYHQTLQPFRSVPLGFELDVSVSGINIGIQALSQDFPIIHFDVALGRPATLHWQPVKGVIVDAVASFATV